MRIGLLAVLVLNIVSSAPAFADQPAVKPYSFSGTCSSQGIWTQEALQTTQALRSFTMQLRDDANCRGLGTRVQAALTNVEDLVKPQADEGYSNFLSQLPQKTGAFRQFLAGNDSFKNIVGNSMYRSEMQGAMMTAQVASDSAGASVATSLGEAAGGPLGALGAIAVGQAANVGGRFARSSQTGLQIFNQVIDAVPQLQECLVDKDGVAAGQFFAGTVKLLTAFAASGQDSTGSSLATAISKLTDMSRTAKFAKILRKTNQADLLASMSCLVEMTSENYCTTRDSQMLYDEMIKQISTRPPDKELSRLGVDNPLAGYYILTQNIPMITSWIQRVQIGVDPRLPTDATFQNKIFDEVNSFYKQIKTIKGNLGYDIEAMKTTQDPKAQKNAARNIIIKLAGLLLPPTQNFGTDDGSTPAKNFFAYVGSSNEIPFILMGIPVPAEVKGTGNGISMDPATWLQNNYDSIPSFNDPVALIDKVQANLETMIDSASKNAVAYYNKFYIIDKLSLVNDSFLGSNYSVYDSLVLTNQYLASVESRIRASGESTSLLPSIQDTRTRVQNVLDSYKELADLSATLQSGNSHLTEDEVAKVADTNLKIVSSVYNEFQVMLGKSGWFSNRVVKFVYADYLIQIKGKNDFGSSINDLFYATGLSLFDQLVTSANGNPAKVQNDLSLALRLNKINLEGVEMLMSDYFAASTADFKGTVKNTAGHSANLVHERAKLHLWARVYREQSAIIPGTNDSAMSAITRGAMQSVWEMALNIPSIVSFDTWGSWARERYLYNYNSDSPDDEFGSANHLYEQFCIQSLAFNDVRPFYALCKGAVLKSPFLDTMLQDLSEEQRQQLSVAYDQKLVESSSDAALNASKRICAFRDYNRKNLVMYLTHSQLAK